jgi:hypothetical protein
MLNQIVEDKNSTGFESNDRCVEKKRNHRKGVEKKKQGIKVSKTKSVFPNCYLSGDSDINPPLPF